MRRRATLRKPHEKTSRRVENRGGKAQNETQKREKTDKEKYQGKPRGGQQRTEAEK